MGCIMILDHGTQHGMVLSNMIGMIVIEIVYNVYIGQYPASGYNHKQMEFRSTSIRGCGGVTGAGHTQACGVMVQCFCTR